MTVTFDASSSADEDGEIVSYDFGGTAQASGATAEHTFADAGVYEVRLTVTDDLGGIAEVVFEVNAREKDAEVPYMVPYVPDATYAEQLRPCTYMGPATERCTLARLPFIGMEHPEPTVDDVMARVLVGERQRCARQVGTAGRKPHRSSSAAGRVSSCTTNSRTRRISWRRPASTTSTRTRPPWPSMVGNFLEWPSTRLSTDRPLRSRVMRELAAVFFLGVEPTPEQETLRPDDIVDEFALDGAVEFYSYSTQYEALADSSDALLMSYHHDYEKDVAVVDREGRTTQESVVAWGQRGRMADEAVIDRARLVIDALYPGDAQALHGYLNARPAPLQMRRGDTWADNLVLEGGASSSPPAVVPGSARPRANVPTGQHATQLNLVGCILVPEGGPAAFRESLGLR